MSSPVDKELSIRNDVKKSRSSSPAPPSRGSRDRKRPSISRSKSPPKNGDRHDISRSRSRSPRRNGGKNYASRSRSRSGSRPRPAYKKKIYDTSSDPTPCKCLGVFGLSLYTEEQDLVRMFEPCGSIQDCTIVYDKRSGRSRGFGFVRFKHQADADHARKKLNGRDLDGRSIRVDYSVTKRPHSPTPGVYMGNDHRDRYYGSSSGARRSRSVSRSRSRSRQRRR